MNYSHLTDSDIERYLDENALASDHDRVHGHMAECVSCTDTWREIVAAHDALMAVHASPDPVDDDADILPSSRDETHTRATMIRAATVLLAALVGVAIGRAVPRAADNHQPTAASCR